MFQQFPMISFLFLCTMLMLIHSMQAMQPKTDNVTVLTVPVLQRLEQLQQMLANRTTNSKTNSMSKFKIVGGRPALSGEAPHQVALLSNNQFICGGSFIAEQTVLTAAHCVYGKESSPSTFKVIYGTLDLTTGSTLSVRSIIRHPDYSSINFSNDVALLHLSSPLKPGTNAGIIPLAESAPPEGAQVRVTGWGRLSAGGPLPDHLQLADELVVIEQKECTSQWSVSITESMLCAHSSRQASCNGDSGGPLTHNGQLVGVVSWGVSTCLHAYLPSVYSNVPHLREWIMANSGAADHHMSVLFWPIMILLILITHFDLIKQQ